MVVVSGGRSHGAGWLLPAVLVGVFPIMALFENLIFAIDGRYAIISFPFLVIAMAIGVDALAGRDDPWLARSACSPRSPSSGRSG